MTARQFFFTLSIILHALLLAMIGVILPLSPAPIIKLGNSDIVSLQSYLYHAEEQSHTDSNKIDTHQNIKSHAIGRQQNLSQTIAVQKTPLPQQQMRKPAMQSTMKHPSVAAASVASKAQQPGIETDALLQLLHEAIQAAQRYPEMAMQLERQGRVTLQFDLTRDGRVSNLHIVKSSGTESLDKAALDAVRNAAPFKNIEQHLKETRAFDIDVIFEI